jgi:hypothetical protein
MNTYTITVKNPAVGSVYDVRILAEDLTTANSQARALYGDLVVYVQVL